MKEKNKLPVVNKELKKLADNIESTYFQYFHKMPLCFEMHNKLISLRNSISAGRLPNELTSFEQVKSELEDIQAQMEKIVEDFERLNAKNIVMLSSAKSKPGFINTFLKLTIDIQKKLLFLADVHICEEILFSNKATLKCHFINNKNGQKEIQQLIDYVFNNVERYKTYIEEKAVKNSI